MVSYYPMRARQAGSYRAQWHDSSTCATNPPQVNKLINVASSKFNTESCVFLILLCMDQECYAILRFFGQLPRDFSVLHSSTVYLYLCPLQNALVCNSEIQAATTCPHGNVVSMASLAIILPVCLTQNDSETLLPLGTAVWMRGKVTFRLRLSVLLHFSS